jgi:hypothetical protein
MRRARTKYEQTAIDLLSRRLSQSGHLVEVDPTVTDAPDALLTVDEVRLAVECRTVSPEKVMELHGLRQQPGDLHCAMIPVEPHMWVRAALLAKNPHVDRYKQRANASSAVLLLHSSSSLSSFSIDKLTDFFLTACVQSLYTLLAIAPFD